MKKFKDWERSGSVKLMQLNAFIWMVLLFGNQQSYGMFSLSTTLGQSSTAPMNSNSMASSNMNSVFNSAPAIDYSSIRNTAETAKTQAGQLEQQRIALEQSIQTAKQSTASRAAPKAESVDELLKSLTDELMAAAPSPRIDVTSIPDPQEASLPYRFVSPDGGFTRELKSIYRDLYKIDPYYENRKEARELGLLAVEEADHSYAVGEADAGFFKELARGFLDIAVGLDPVTGFARSAYELVIGKNLITGETLNVGERGIAFVGIVTAYSGQFARLLSPQESYSLIAFGVLYRFEFLNSYIKTSSFATTGMKMNIGLNSALGLETEIISRVSGILEASYSFPFIYQTFANGIGFSIGIRYYL